MKIGTVQLDSPFVVSPMAGMTDTAFRRLVKRQGGCGLVVSEMVSSEGLVRGIDRTLEYAEYTEEERPVAIQIFGGEPAKMAEAARVVEAMGANIVDVNMGCPVPKIAKHNAGCSLMREPQHAAEIIAAMTRAVKIPVTVKMRKGWDDGEVNALELAKRVEAAGAAAIAVHGRTAKQSYSGTADWEVVAGIARSVSIPVFGSGDCVEPEDIVARMRSGVSGVFVGRGVLRNPWILAQARDLMAGRPARQITDEDRGQFLLDYMQLLLAENVDEAAGFRHSAGTNVASGFSRTLLGTNVASGFSRTLPGANVASGFSRTLPGTNVASGFSRTLPGANVVSGFSRTSPAVGREKWVVNKLRALCTWYTKGFEGGAQFRIGINSAKSIGEVEDLVANFFH